MKIIINKETCIGCGACAACCQDIFEIVDNKAQPKVKELSENNKSCAKEGMNACPVNAIKIE